MARQHTSAFCVRGVDDLEQEGRCGGHGSTGADDGRPRFTRNVPFPAHEVARGEDDEISEVKEPDLSKESVVLV